MSSSLYVLAACVTLLVYRCARYVFILKHYNHYPGYRPLFGPHSFPGLLIPTTWWHRGFMWAWDQRGSAHFGYSSDVTTTIPFLGDAFYILGSRNIAKQVLGIESKARINRPYGLSTPRIWGHSVASANGADWKRQRRIISPVFNSQMYTSVMEETTKLYRSMMNSEGWSGQSELTVPHLNPFMLRFTQVVICRCGFGLPIEWTPRKDGTMLAHFEEALSFATDTLHIRILTPNWLWALPFNFVCNVNHAWRTLTEQLKEVASSRRRELDGDSDSSTNPSSLENLDILTNLVSATDDISSKFSMTPTEVTGNMLTLLFAGNETTASALSSVLVFLALHPDEQAKAYQDILDHTSHEKPLTIATIQEMTHLYACVLEAVRLVPPFGHAFRNVDEDITIQSTRPTDRAVHMARGTHVMVDMFSIAHNPHDYPDPDSFVPSRWYGVPEHDVPMFGLGPRACLGRKFAQIEIMTALVQFLLNWKLEVVMGVGQTRDAMLKEALKDALFLRTAFLLPPVPLKFTARIK